MASADLALDKGLPVNLDAERFVLGSILLDDSLFVQVAGQIVPEDFAIEAHRRIFSRMMEIQERSERIDRVTVAHELMKHSQLESVGGMTYLVTLDEGLPHISNFDSYVRIVKAKSTLRRILFAARSLEKRCLLGEEEPEEILADAEDTLLKLNDTRGAGTMATPRQIIESYQGGLNAFLDPSKRIKGTSTHLTKFNEMTGGLRGGELFILAARPAMGKTALALNIAQHVALQVGEPVAVFSLEMSKESLLTRMLCALGRVDSQKFRAGFLNGDERRRLQVAASQMSGAPLYIDDTPGTNLMDVHAKLRRLQADRKLGLVVIDYLQLMSSRGRYENRNQEVSALSRGFKLMSKELDVPFLVLSQLSRATETRQGDHRPQLSDLRESGSIEQDADLVAFIFREEVYKQDRQDLRGLAELILAKQRSGPTGKVQMTFIHEYTKFENRIADMDGEGGGGDGPPPFDE